MKFWKNWPYWVRGGMIFAGLAILSIISIKVCEGLIGPSGDDGSGGFLCLPFAIFFVPFWFTPLTDLPEWLYIIVTSATWFVIGMCLGGVLDYLKYKKRARN